MKNCILWATVLLLSCCLLIGCSDGEEGEEQLEKERLMEDQVQILIAAGFDEARIRRGDLTSVERRVLEDYQFALNYLEKKYGEQKFDVVDCTPPTRELSRTVFYGTFADYSGELCEVEVKMKRDEKYAVDNCYGIIMKESYQSYLEKVLMSWGMTCLEIDAELPELYGEEYDRNCMPEQAIEQGMELSGTAWIVIDGDGMTEDECIARLQELKNKFKEEGLAGSFRIGFAGSETEYSDFINIFPSKQEEV